MPSLFIYTMNIITSYVKLFLCEPARFHRNDTSRRRVDSLSVLKKRQLLIKRLEIVLTFINEYNMFNLVSVYGQQRKIGPVRGTKDDGGE